jgi:citrate synthase
MVWLTAQETADRLGVKLETVYAYASRGVLDRVRASDGRTSRFDAKAVEALARRGRPRVASRGPAFDVQVDTAVTEVDGLTLRYRGLDAARLSAEATFEQVAQLLWAGNLPVRFAPWASSSLSVPERGDLPDRVRVAVALAAADDLSRADLRPEAVAACGRSLIATVVDSLPAPGDGRTPRLVLADGRAPLRDTIAGRLWARLAHVRPHPESVAVLNAALVLLADHDLAASTFAARVAASVRADPYAVVSAGMGPLSGALHGGASRRGRSLLDRAAMPGGAPGAIAEVLRAGGVIPGFGHPLYPDGDPRAIVLLDRLRRIAGGSPAMAVADSVIAAARQRAPIHPNVDFALAALGTVARMPPDAGEVIFTIARMAGWLAHAIEEYEEAPLRFRPRARYRPR